MFPSGVLLGFYRILGLLTGYSNVFYESQIIIPLTVAPGDLVFVFLLLLKITCNTLKRNNESKLVPKKCRWC